MNEGALPIEVTEEDGFTIVRLEGSLLRTNHEELLERLEAIADTATRGVALDFERVDFLDSSALGSCAAAAKTMTRGGDRGYVVFGANRTIARMWNMVGIDQMVPLLPDRESAMAHLKEKARAGS